MQAQEIQTNAKHLFRSTEIIMNKAFEDIQATSKEGFEVCVTSATVLSKGMQDIATETAEFSAKSFEKGTAAVETLMAAKTFDKVIEAQQGIAKQAYEDFIGQMTKVGEMYTASATEAFKPVEAQLAKFAPAASAKKTAGK